MIINVKGAQTTVNATATTVDNATCMRVIASANTLVTIRDASNNVLGSVTILGGTSEYIEKLQSDTIEANVDLTVTSVGFTIS